MARPRGKQRSGKAGQSRPRPLDEATRRKLELYQQLAMTIKGVAWIAASWIPLQPVQSMVHDLAGKNTNFSAVISIEFYYAIAASAGWATTAVRSHSRRKELERLRARTKELEAKLVPDDDRADVIDEDEA